MAVKGDYHPSTGVAPWKVRREYSTYKSPYGPKYSINPHVGGWTAKSFTRLGMTLGGFGGVAGFFALFFFSDVPAVRRDIMVKVPGLGEQFVKEVPASDNPF
ncbi:ubiquinol-cytochrome-c reductase complex subunit-domain-containing protein [Amylocarpus encephaloides]|uniref:Ubiquinol-cytochrome-c reductase complex subunit-domain-containing protein n=1 Tax=Amylocarpus encephaloides TaxID=45428 RepID=A0A9P7Y5M7_9HELO|nr:ubiquinol-cytochrome-c reductase complex subunit-domain-containing protein [Amylocarpus encephaloides]